MSTLKSSNDHLTLNADGTSKDIKFQADGVEKASISSAGLFTSTTIDATKLIGNLPAISGASLTGVGVDGIVSSANATAITITSAELVILANGITFNGDTATANALDDYEKGTFTPGISFTGGGTATWNVRTGYYRKIGSICYISMIVYPASLSSQSGYMQLNGLPFARTATGSGSDRDSGQMIYDRINTNGNGLIPYINANSSFCYVTSPRGSNGSAADTIGSGEIVGNSFMQVSITYMTS